MTLPDPHALYEALARWQWRRRARRAAPGEGLELRKRLHAPAAGTEGPADGAGGLDGWLGTLLGRRTGVRVLDLGCGFGASSFRWARAGARLCLGVTASAFQVQCAERAARELGLASICSFRCADFAAAPDGPFDVVLAIEALGHAPLLAPVLQRVHDVLAPGGSLFWVDDVRAEGIDEDDADVRELARHWRSPSLRGLDEVRAAIAAAGLVRRREIDLSAQVPWSAPARLHWRARLLKLARRWSPMRAQRLVAAAFLGGVHLERLHARRAAQYRLSWCVRPAVAATTAEGT